MTETTQFDEKETEEKEEDNRHPMLDPELVSHLKHDVPIEDPMITEYNSGGKNGDSGISFAEKWFPKEEEWQAKTFISWEQARALSIMRNYSSIFPELEEDQEWLNGVVEDFEKYLTSVEGRSRADHRAILTSIFGGDPEEEDRFSAFINAFGGGRKDD